MQKVLTVIAQLNAQQSAKTAKGRIVLVNIVTARKVRNVKNVMMLQIPKLKMQKNKSHRANLDEAALDFRASAAFSVLLLASVIQ
jgi:hypothetical protein